MNNDVICKIQHALDLLCEAAKLTALDVAYIAPDNYDIRQNKKILKYIEEAKVTIATLDSFQ